MQTVRTLLIVFGCACFSMPLTLHIYLRQRRSSRIQNSGTSDVGSDAESMASTAASLTTPTQRRRTRRAAAGDTGAIQTTSPVRRTSRRLATATETKLRPIEENKEVPPEDAQSGIPSSVKGRRQIKKDIEASQSAPEGSADGLENMAHIGDNGVNEGEVLPEGVLSPSKRARHSQEPKIKATPTLRRSSRRRKESEAEEVAQSSTNSTEAQVSPITEPGEALSQAEISLSIKDVERTEPLEKQSIEEQDSTLVDVQKQQEESEAVTDFKAETSEAKVEGIEKQDVKHQEKEKSDGTSEVNSDEERPETTSSEEEEGSCEDDLDDLVALASEAFKPPTVKNSKPSSRNDPLTAAPRQLKSGLKMPSYLKSKDKEPVTVSTSLFSSVLAEAEASSVAAIASSQQEITKEKKAGKALQTAGSKWFDMVTPELTPSVKRDLEVLKMRNFIDPKRFYKSSDIKRKETPKHFQIGTVVEGAGEFTYARMTKKERKGTMLEELMNDYQTRKYAKRKFLEVQEAKSSGGKKWMKQKKRKHGR